MQVSFKKRCVFESVSHSNASFFVYLVDNATESYSVSINSPGNLYIDDHNRLVTNEWYGRLIQMDRYNLSIINRITLNTTLAAALSYNDGLYYIGTGGSGYSSSENSLLVYNSSTMDLLIKITGNSNYFGPIRQCSFASNNTLMLVLSQTTYTYSLILFYQINSPTNYTLLSSNIQTSDFSAYNIFKVNDTFFYFVLYLPNKPIYTLSSSANGQTWSVGTFVTEGPQPTLISGVTVDSCGRVWAADPYSYIYIYEATTGALLGTFTKISNPYYILLLDNYELFVSTATNQTYRLAPNIQCSC
jgi:hypothetical protein